MVLGAVLAIAAGYWLSTRDATETKDPRDIPFAKEPPVPDGLAWFRDMTPGSGIDFPYRNGEEADLYTILESVGGGVAMIDFDNDGLLDLFFTGGGWLEKDRATSANGNSRTSRRMSGSTSSTSTRTASRSPITTGTAGPISSSPASAASCCFAMTRANVSSTRPRRPASAWTAGRPVPASRT
jgi:hypothetical protein